MTAGEVEGVPGKQEDGAAKTREAKAIVPVRPKAGTRRPGSRERTGAAALLTFASPARSRRAAPAGRRSSRGASSGSGLRKGLFEAGELVVLSDGAAWIRDVCEEVFIGMRTTFILNHFHALDCAAAAVRVGSSLRTGAGGRRRWRGSRRN